MTLTTDLAKLKELPNKPGGANSALKLVVRWYFNHAYGIWDGVEPFYCKKSMVGWLAVSRKGLAEGTDEALFRLFVLLSMYQALRDEVVRRRQRELQGSEARVLGDLRTLQGAIAKNDCFALSSAIEFERACDVEKAGRVVDCGLNPGIPCHVKEATLAFNRMGDMGKLPSSAWLHFWKAGGMKRLLVEVCVLEKAPARRAELLVERFSVVHRVGRKLATMFVSALSTPALAPGLTPWFPEISGNELVVVDTNVASAVDLLRQADTMRTYEARAAWVRDQAAHLDLREFRKDVPSYSPRLVQQALYTFCSRSNRMAREDPCALVPGHCYECAPELCPFV